MLSHNIRRASILLIASHLLLVSLGYITNFWLGRFLGAELYGSYGIVIGLATILNLMLVPGIIQGISKIVSQNKSDAIAILGHALRLGLISSAVITFLYVLAVPMISSLLGDSGLNFHLYVIATMIPMYIITSIYSGYFTGTQTFRKQSLIFVIYAVARFLLTIGLALTMMLTGAIWAFVLGAFCGLSYAFFASPRVRLVRVTYSSKLLKTIITLSIYTGLLALLMHIDLFAVKIFSGNVETGLYTASAVIAKLPYLLLTSLTLVVMPAMAGAKNNPERARKLAMHINRYLMLVLLPIVILISANATSTISLLYGSSYESAGSVLQFLVLATGLATLMSVNLTMINALRSATRAITLISLLLIIAGVLSTTMVADFGIAGASEMMFIVLGIGCAIAVAMTILQFKVFIPIASMIRIGIALLITATVAASLDFGNLILLPLEFALLFLLYAGVLLIIREVRLNEFTALRALIKR